MWISLYYFQIRFLDAEVTFYYFRDFWYNWYMTWLGEFIIRYGSLLHRLTHLHNKY